MPRTKRVRSPKPLAAAKDDPQQAREVEAIKKHALQETMERQIQMVEEQAEAHLAQLNLKKKEIISKIPSFLLGRTIREIMAGEVSSQTTICSSIMSDADTTNLRNASRTVSATRIPNSTAKSASRTNSETRTNSATRGLANSTMKVNSNTRSSTRKRSLSATYDVSLESSQLSNASTVANSNSNRSRARTANKNTSAKPLSRSLSRTGQKPISSQFKTPTSKTPTNDMGTITPKVNRNTPQVLLRRPKQGEMAISFQGSPLLTGTVCREDMANINIPLPNGDLLSLLPQSGLRPSLIPNVGDDTRRQLEILRDNLIQVCSNMQSHKKQ